MSRLRREHDRIHLDKNRLERYPIHRRSLGSEGLQSIARSQCQRKFSRGKQADPARRAAALQDRFLLGELLKITQRFFFAPDAHESGKYNLPVVDAEGDFAASPSGL